MRKRDWLGLAIFAVCGTVFAGAMWVVLIRWAVSL